MKKRKPEVDINLDCVMPVRVRSTLFDFGDGTHRELR